LSERPTLPPTLSAMDFPAGWTQVLVVCWINRINCYRVKSDDDCAYESISDTKMWLSCISHLENPNVVKDLWGADDKTDEVLDKCFSILECQEHQVVCMAPNVRRFIQPNKGHWRSLKRGWSW
jgi:hypothetical protein